MGQITTAIKSKGTGKCLEVQINGRTFELPFKLIGGREVAFLDISGQVSLVESCADMLAEKIMESEIEFDTILNPVSKSNALAHAVAVRLMEKIKADLSHTVVARKAKPGESHAVEASYHSVTTSGDQVMYLTDDDVVYIKGKKILLIDDVFGQGGTTKGLTNLCDKAGATITGQAVVAVEGSNGFPESLIYLFRLPVL